MALGTIVNKRRFETGLDAGDDSLVNIAFFLFLGGQFDVEVNEFLTIDNRDTEFLGLCRIEQHAFHNMLPRDIAKGAPCAGSVGLVEWGRLHGLSVMATGLFAGKNFHQALKFRAGEICLGRSERVRRAQIK